MNQNEVGIGIKLNIGLKYLKFKMTFLFINFSGCIKNLEWNIKYSMEYGKHGMEYEKHGMEYSQYLNGCEVISQLTSINITCFINFIPTSIRKGGRATPGKPIMNYIETENDEDEE